MRFLVLAVLFGLMLLLQGAGFVDPSNILARSMVAFGFLILAGTVAGGLTRRLRLPGITGYLLAGVICGPDLLHLVRADVLQNLNFINSTALTFIALLAGAELKVSMLRERLRGIVWIAAMQAVPGMLLISAAFLPIFSYLPSLAGYSFAQLVALTLLLGLISVAVSPSTTVAVIVESRAQGPVKDTVLGVTMVMDVMVILLFTLLVSLVGPLLATDLTAPNLLQLFLEIAFSLLAGGLTGVIGILILHFIKQHQTLVMLGLGLLIVDLSHDFHLDPLLVAITGGFLIANFSEYGERFQTNIEKASLPIFLVFFALAGAGLDFGRLAGTWPLALALVLLRMGAKLLTTRWGAMPGRLEPTVKRYGWLGFIGQAGVSLGFVMLLEEQFPEAGGFLKQIIVAAIVINQIIGPVLLQYAFDRCGETGRAGAVTDKSVASGD